MFNASTATLSAALIPPAFQILVLKKKLPPLLSECIILPPLVSALMKEYWNYGLYKFCLNDAIKKVEQWR